jgi:hypothetical protein
MACAPNWNYGRWALKFGERLAAVIGAFSSVVLALSAPAMLLFKKDIKLLIAANLARSLRHHRAAWLTPPATAKVIAELQAVGSSISSLGLIGLPKAPFGRSLRGNRILRISRPMVV